MIQEAKIMSGETVKEVGITTLCFAPSYFSGLMEWSPLITTFTAYLGFFIIAHRFATTLVIPLYKLIKKWGKKD